MNTWPPGDDEALVAQLRAAYEREVSRVEEGGTTRPSRTVVRAGGLLSGGRLVGVGLAAVLLAGTFVALQRGVVPWAPTTPSGSAPPGAGSPAGSALPAAAGPSAQASKTFAFSAYQWLRSPVEIEVSDSSGLLVSARGIGEFEGVPPATSGLAAVNRPAGDASETVVVKWPASSCERSWTIAVNESVRAVSIGPRDGTTVHCADLTGYVVVLVFRTPIDASTIAVSLASR